LTDAGASLLDLLLSLAAGTGASLVPTRVDARLTRARESVDVRASLSLSFSPGPHADVTLIGDATEAVEVIQLFGENGTAGWLLREGTPPLLYLRPQGGPAEEADSARFRGPLPDDAFVTALATPGRTFGQDHAPDLFDAAFVVPLVALLERIHAEAGLS
jgi:hypothetical protein